MSTSCPRRSGAVEASGVCRRVAECHHGEYADAKAVLTRCLDLLDNFAGRYARCDDLTRRLCNQALFPKVFVEDDLRLRPEQPSRSSCSSTPESRRAP